MEEDKEVNTPRAQRTRRRNKDKIKVSRLIHLRAQRTRRKNKDKIKVKIKVRILIYLEDRGQEERTRTRSK